MEAVNNKGGRRVFKTFIYWLSSQTSSEKPVWKLSGHKRPVAGAQRRPARKNSDSGDWVTPREEHLFISRRPTSVSFQRTGRGFTENQFSGGRLGHMCVCEVASPTGRAKRSCHLLFDPVRGHTELWVYRTSVYWYRFIRRWILQICCWNSPSRETFWSPFCKNTK